MTTAVDQTAIEAGGYGLISEDVMNKLYVISPEDRPLVDAAGTEDMGNVLKEWVGEILAAASKDNAAVDGVDLTGDNTQEGNRYGNYAQNMIKEVKVSFRAQNVSTVYRQQELTKQLMLRQRELRRDEEAAKTSNNAAVAPAAAVAGKLAGLGSWMIGSAITGSDANRISRGAGGADPVLSGATNLGGIPTTAPTVGNHRGITETLLRQVIRACYNDGGNPTMILSTPSMIEVISDWMFNSSARVATIQTNVPQGNRTNVSSGNGNSGGGVVAQGSVNVFVSNFGTLELVPDRFQPTYTSADAATVANVFILDPTMLANAYLQGYETRELGRTGLSDKRVISVDTTLCVMAIQAHGVIADCNPSTAMTA